MSSIDSEEIYNAFLGYIRDNSILENDEDVVMEFMADWFKKSYSKPYVRRLFKSLSYSDVAETLEYELKFKTTEDADKDFIVDVLALGMVEAWLSPLIRRTSNLIQMFGGKEQKFYSQASHIEQLRAVYEDAKLEQRKLIMDRGFAFNSYLEGV